MKFQPCDWLEHDVGFQYTVDVFGRTDENEVARVRLTDFKPYFYARKTATLASIQQVKTFLESKSGKGLRGLIISEVSKLDVMAGFNNLIPVSVWKIQCTAAWMYKTCVKCFSDNKNCMFESGLPPYFRLFHELSLQPASCFEFDPLIADEADPDSDGTLNVDVCFTLPYDKITVCGDETLPLLVCSYDLEVYSATGLFPVSTNPADEIIQIGLSFRWSNDLFKNHKRVVLVSGTCDKAPEGSNVDFISCKNEKTLLKMFEKTVQEENPDVIVGYNTFGFDDGYVSDRAHYHAIALALYRFNPNGWKDTQECVPVIKKEFKLASGQFDVRYLDLTGRLSIDLLLSIRREQNLESYSLDNVAATFLRNKINKCDHSTIKTWNTRGLFEGNLVKFDIVTNTSNLYRNGQKFKVNNVTANSFEIDSDDIFSDLTDGQKKKLEWCFTKDDITAKEIFALHRGSSTDRARIAKYCIQDCDLVLTLIAKLDTFVNACGMANVCKVPIQFIFLRGQGIKIFSAVVDAASKRNQIIATQENSFAFGDSTDDSYEGAIVLSPKIGIYLDQPIAVLDFNSLYPSNMIAFNLSPDTLAYVKTYNTSGKRIAYEGMEQKDILPEFKVDEISYDIRNDEDVVVGRKTCGFVQPAVADSSNTTGVLPLVLAMLLQKRKDVRKLMETTTDNSQKSVYNGLQLAYKTVANSIYGQMGSKTSPIRKLEVAASTTAAGRDKLQFAKSVVESEFRGSVIYGDTDSIFIKFDTKSLSESINTAKLAAERITSQCRKPYKIEYEKTFYPFILFCRKRYVGMMYEDDPTPGKCKRKSMGVATKRRDFAPIVKDIYGGALDILMETRDIKKAERFVKDMLVDLMQNKVPLEKFIITKQLRDDYKKPEQIAHRVLADRMAVRDPGNKPQVGDRLSYIFVENNRQKKGEKQGDKIEDIDYVKSHKLKPDIEFYITNQIQNSTAQLFAMVIEQMDGYKPKKYTYDGPDLPDSDRKEEQMALYILSKKEKDIDKLLFLGANYLNKHKRGAMDMFVTRT